MNGYRKREDSPTVPGAAYIRFSSEMQSDSFSLDAQLRQIKEQAERDGVEIVNVFADPAQSAIVRSFAQGSMPCANRPAWGTSRSCTSTR